MMTDKRITILSGHYGSGKSNIAVALALEYKKKQEKVLLADIDIVNPYFRSKDRELELREKGIRLISSQFANSNLDVPALPQEMYSVVDDKSFSAVVDVGGDDRGALALGRLKDGILMENNFNMLAVVNMYRPLTRTPRETLEVLKEIESVSHIPWSGIINNSNLGKETTAQDVLDSEKYAKELSKISNLPIFLTTVSQQLYNELIGKIGNLFALNLK